MVSFEGKHAGFYDLFYAEKPYGEESEFVHQCFTKYSKEPVHNVLELACGTGNHAFELVKKGYQVIATDYSDDMLSCAEQKSTHRSENPQFRKMDMRQFLDFEEPFDAVICLFDSLGYVQTNDNVIKVLKNVHASLIDKGLFVFEFWNAGGMLRNYEPLREKRFKGEDGEIVRVSETKINYPQQTCEVTYSVFEAKDGMSNAILTETQINRFFLVQEMAFYLSIANFEPLKWFSGFSFNENITEDTWHIVCVAKVTS